MRISNIKKAKVLNAIETGMTIEQASTKFGVSAGTITNWKAAARTAGVTPARTIARTVAKTRRRPNVLNTSVSGLARENQILRGIVGETLVEQLLKSH